MKELITILLAGSAAVFLSACGSSSGDSSGAYSANPSDWDERVPDVIEIYYHANPSECNAGSGTDPQIHNLTASIENNSVNCDTYGRLQTYKDDNDESRLDCWITDMADINPDSLQYDTSCVYIYDMDND